MMQEVSQVHQESSHGWKVTDNTENQEEDRLLDTETAEGSLKAVGDLDLEEGWHLDTGAWWKRLPQGGERSAGGNPTH